MRPPSLDTRTEAAVSVIPQLDRDGAQVFVVLIKQRYEIDRRDHVEPAAGAEIAAVDLPWNEDEPETSSIKVPSDVCIRKPGTDVVVVGDAVAPYRSRQDHLDVLVRVGPLEKTLRVFGTRVWTRTLAGALVPSAALPFESVPILWEHAWGGSDMSDPQRPLEEPANPVGRGVTRDPASLVDTPAHQVEDLRSHVGDRTSHPPPAGLGAIGRAWEPRRRYTGTADERWRRTRMPLPPIDFDDRFNQAAAPGLFAESHFRGDEPVEIANMCEDGGLRFALPRSVYHVGARADAGPWTEYAAVMDTVLLMPNERMMDLTYRAVVPCPRQATMRVRSVRVLEKVLLG